ncbi:hypothetical protein ES703_59395 [subsurface metagenome]
MSHLYDAILIPYDQLKAGDMSQLASEILANYSFTKVFNMLGGIIAWIDANYPIYTTFHHVTVDKIEEGTLLQIEPLIKSNYVSCAENQTCPICSEPMDIMFPVLEEEEDYTEILFAYEINNTTIEGTKLRL